MSSLPQDLLNIIESYSGLLINKKDTKKHTKLLGIKYLCKNCGKYKYLKSMDLYNECKKCDTTRTEVMYNKLMVLNDLKHTIKLVKRFKNRELDFLTSKLFINF